MRLSSLRNLALAALVSGCTLFDESSRSGPALDNQAALALADVETAASRERRLAPEIKPEPALRKPPKPRAKPKLAMKIPADVANVPPPRVTLENLVGLTFDEAYALLGDPNLATEVPPAKVQAYNSKSCTLNVFFYFDLETEKYRSLAYEVKGEDKSEGSKERCLMEILADGSV